MQKKNIAMEQFPKMLRLVEHLDDIDDYSSYDVFSYVPLNNTTIFVNYNNNTTTGASKLIDIIGDITGTYYEYILSNNNTLFKIADLHCKTYIEFLITLDLYDLIYDPNVINEDVKKFKQDHIASLQKLVSENQQLKNKLTQLKKTINAKLN